MSCPLTGHQPRSAALHRVLFKACGFVLMPCFYLKTNKGSKDWSNLCMWGLVKSIDMHFTQQGMSTQIHFLKANKSAMFFVKVDKNKIGKSIPKTFCVHKQPGGWTLKKLLCFAQFLHAQNRPKNSTSHFLLWIQVIPPFYFFYSPFLLFCQPHIIFSLTPTPLNFSLCPPSTYLFYPDQSVFFTQPLHAPFRSVWIFSATSPYQPTSLPTLPASCPPWTHLARPH